MVQEISELLQAITALEAQRGSVDSQVVDAALAPLETKLAILEQSQPANRQRRIVTVMFVDIVDSTHLSQGMEPEEVQESIGWALKKLSVPVEKNGGLVAQVMGDGFMAVFGLVKTQENDAQHAVRAGLEILKEKQICAAELEQRYGMRDFNVRIGINTGRVVVGQPALHESPVMGLTVSLAARMEQTAIPGCLVISQFTQQHVRGAFDWEAISPVEAKGFGEPIPAFRVLTARPTTFRTSTRGVDGMVTAMIGRVEELKQLQSAFLQSSQNRECQMMTILGDAGVGKSRLLYEFDQWLASSQSKVKAFKARALQEMMAVPFGVLRDMISYQIGILSTDPVETAQQRLEEAFSEYLAEEPEMKAHFVGSVLGFPFTKSSYLAGVLNDPKQLYDRAERYLIHYLSAVADKTPIVIMLDDIQWGDVSSVSFIRRLVATCQNLPILVICLARESLYERFPDWEVDGLASQGDQTNESHKSVCQTLVLQPISRQESMMLLSALLDDIEILPEGIQKQILDQADGNPLFLEEYVQTLVDKQAIYKSSNAPGWKVDGEKLKKLELPATLIALLEARLDSLNASQRMLIQQAAVLGQVFWRSGLQSLRGENVITEKDMEVLTTRGFIHLRDRSTFDNTEEYCFHHGLLRDTAYETLFKSDRKMYHRKAADWMNEVLNSTGRTGELAPIIAEHYEAGDEPVLAADWYIQSGRGARNQGAPVQALEFYERGLRLLQKHEKSTVTKIDLYRHWEALSGRNEVLGILGEAERRMTDDSALVELAEKIGDAHLVAEAYSRKGYSNELRGQYSNAVEAYDHGLEAADQANDIRRKALLLGLKVVCMTRLGDLEGALNTSSKALKYAEESGDELVLARNLNNVSFFYTEAGDLAKAAQLLDQQLTVNRRTGNQEEEMIGLANLGYLYILLGMPEEGINALQKSIEMAQAMSHRGIRASICLNLALAHLRNGDHASASAKLEQCLPEFAVMNNQFSLAVGNTYSAMVKEQMGQLNEALGDYQRAGTSLMQIGTSGYAYDAKAGEARCKLLLGDMKGAEREADPVWNYLKQGTKAGMEFQMLGFETCADVYAANGNENLAREIIDKGYHELMGRAERISLVEWRESFLERIPEHQRMIKRWNELFQKPNQEGEG